ncbi:restriction endonuclease [Nocardiopsis dassonvillei]|uniref:restriction endonuclease n=1 Tax=Nocardiopsis dassonvillei TaxID=2014 RepID=UPI0036F8D8A2
MRDDLIKFSERLGFRTQNEPHGIKIKLPCSPILLRLEESFNDKYFAAFYVRTSSWDWNGERTDLHDSFSLLLAAYLAASNTASCTLIEVPHPAAETASGEIYARYVLPTQPHMCYYSSSINEENSAYSLINEFYYFEEFIHTWIDLHPNEDNISLLKGYLGVEEWITSYSSSLDLEPSEEDTASERPQPPILHWRSGKGQQSCFRSRQISTALLALSKSSTQQSIEVRSGLVFSTDQIKNFVTHRELHSIQKCMSTLEGSKKIDSIEVFAFDNYIVAQQGATVVSIPSDSGRNGIERERENILSTYQDLSRILFPSVIFTWNETVDPGRFEALIRELLLREPGVARVRSVGSTNEPDGGRDLIAEWLLPEQDFSCLEEGDPLLKNRNVIIQCKAYKKSVGKRDIPGVRDMLEFHDSDGYMLISSGQIATSATDHLIWLRKQGNIFSDWWTRPEIEDRLRKNLDIARRYIDIFSMAESETS